MSEQLELEALLGWISSVGASHAKTSASPGKVADSLARALVYGSNSLESFASWDPASSSWKTSQRSLFAEWMPWSEPWPIAGMMRSGSAYQLLTLALPTYVSGSSSLPTPTAKANMLAPSMQKWPAHRNLMTGHGQLNPMWVEWLMGFPIGWTDCEPSATR